MPDNLTISFGADTSKLRVELEKAKQEIAQFSRQLKEAVKIGDQPGALRAAQQIDVVTRSMRTLQAQTIATYRTVAAPQPWQAVTRNMSDFARSVSPLAGMFSNLRAGFVGMVAGEVFQKVAQGIKQVTSNILELQRQATSTGQAPATIQAVKSIAEGIGLQGDDAFRVLYTIRKGLDEVRVAANNAGQSIGTGLTILRGNRQEVEQTGLSIANTLGLITANTRDLEAAARRLPPEVLRGGAINKIEITDTLSAYRALGIAANTFGDSLRDQRNLLTAIGLRLRAFREAGGERALIAEEAGRQLLNKSYRDSIQLLDAIIDKLDQEIARQKQTGEAAATTKENAAAAREFNEALTELWGTLRGIWTSSVTQAFPALTFFVRGLNLVIGTMRDFYAWQLRIFSPAAMQPYAETIVAGAQAAYDGVIKVWNTLPAYFVSLGSAIGDAFTNAWAAILQAAQRAIDWITNQINAAKSAIGLPTSGDYGGGGSTFASGGRVPGSGSGDTVPAMLTPGEYVNRVSSVRYYGAGLFNALNARAIPRSYFDGIGYALGGLVDSIHKPVHLAEGGMVPAMAGTPIHLHLGSKEFVAHAAPAIAQALVRESRVQQMASAGIKPSWVR